MMLALLLCLAQKPPDVLVVVLDDVAKVDMAQAQTPYIDSLAQAGVTFTNAYASPKCAPTRRSLQTGMWWISGNTNTCQPPDQNTPALSEVFLPEAMPCYSAALFGKWHLGPDPEGGPFECAPKKQGYSYWFRGSAANLQEDPCDIVQGLSYDVWLRSEAVGSGCSTSQTMSYNPFVVAEKLVTTWSQATPPRMSVVNINLAHAPFHAPPAWLLPDGYPTPQTATQKFRAMITAYDTLIGYMLTAAPVESTMWVVVGDNGTPPAVAGLQSSKAKGTTFERGIKVPLVIAGPLVVSPGRTDPGLVHVVDIFQTCVAIAMGTTQSDGISLLPALQNQPQTYHDYVLSGSSWGDTGGDRASVSSGRTKLRQLDNDGDGLVDVEQYYDLLQDPGETVNLIGDPSRAQEIQAHRDWIEANKP